MTDQEIVERFAKIGEEFSRLSSRYASTTMEHGPELVLRANQLTAAATILCRIEQTRLANLKTQLAH